MIIFDKLGDRQPERNGDNPARSIQPTPSFMPRIEASPVFSQRIEGLALWAEGTTEPTKKGTHNRRSYPVISGHSTSGFCKWSRPLLTESDPQTEFDVTHRKQTTEKFLTEARTHISDFAIWRILR